MSVLALLIGIGSFPDGEVKEEHTTRFVQETIQGWCASHTDRLTCVSAVLFWVVLGFWSYQRRDFGSRTPTK